MTDKKLPSKVDNTNIKDPKKKRLFEFAFNAIKLDRKCRFYNNCEYVQKDAPVCNSERQAKSYCGAYRDNALR